MDEKNVLIEELMAHHLTKTRIAEAVQRMTTKASDSDRINLKANLESCMHKALSQAWDQPLPPIPDQWTRDTISNFSTLITGGDYSDRYEEFAWSDINPIGDLCINIGDYARAKGEIFHLANFLIPFRRAIGKPILPGVNYEHGPWLCIIEQTMDCAPKPLDDLNTEIITEACADIAVQCLGMAKKLHSKSELAGLKELPLTPSEPS